MGQTKITFIDIQVQKGGKWKIKRSHCSMEILKSSQANVESFLIQFQGLRTILCGSRLYLLALGSAF